MKRHIIHLALIVVSALLIPSPVDAQVHFGLPSTVKNAVKKLKSKKNSATVAAANHAPVISSLTADPISVSTGAITTIICTASDLDGDTLIYNWSAASGAITGSGSQVTWTAPTSSSTYTISCTVSDGNGGSAQLSVNVMVTEGNNPPVISSVIANPASISTGAVTTITCAASDLDDDTLTYTWDAASGTISGSGSQVTWTAPSSSSTYTISCTVSDGKGGFAQSSVNITVAKTNNPPVISSLTADPVYISTGAVTTITCTASDLDSDTLTYNWSAASGAISGSGSQITWTAPASSSTYTISCTVSDGNGGSVQQSVNVMVTVSAIVLGPSTKVLTGDTNSKFLSVSPDSVTYYYDISAAQLAGLSSGDIMLSSQGNGLLKKIVSISATSTEYIVQTTTATLEEAFEKLNVTFSQTFTPSQVSPQYLKSFKLQSVPPGQFELSTSVVLSPNITADATLIFTPSIDGKIEIDGFQLKEFAFTSIFDGQLELVLTADIAETLTKEIKVAEFPLGVIMAGPVPIVANYAIKVGVEANLQAAVTTGVTQEVSFEAGVTYLNGVWTPHNVLSSTFTFNPPTFSAEGSLKGYIAPEINAKILDVAGPYVDAEGYLKGIVTTPLVHLPWAVKGGIGINAGVKVEVLSWALAEWSAELYNAEIQLSSGALLNQAPAISAVTPNPASISTEAVTTITCAASDTDGDILTYTWSAASGTVSGTGSQITWTAPTAESTYTITCDVSDGWGGSVQKSTNVVVTTAGQNHAPVISSLTADPASISTGAVTTITCAASDPDSDPLTYNWSAASGTISGSGAQVTWTAPASSSTYTIFCTVSDGNGGSAQTSVSVGAYPHELPDTGQEQSYTTTPGEDHDYQPAASQPSYTDNGDGTTTDNKTGLMWVKDGNSAGCNNGSSLTWEAALNFCEGLPYAGYSDWRLPNVRELESIVDAGESYPAINTAYFSNTQSSRYWTSTTYVPSTDTAWLVSFSHGHVGYYYKTSASSVRCVRAGP